MTSKSLVLALLGSGLATALTACGPSGLVTNEAGNGAPTFQPGSRGPLLSGNSAPVERGLPTDAPPSAPLAAATSPDIPPAAPIAPPSASTTAKCKVASKDPAIAQICGILNQERAKQKLLPLQLDAKLNAVAQAFAQDMADKGYFSHTSPTGQTMEDRFKAGGLSFGWAGENIAEGQKDAVEVMKSWMNSPGHRENILGPHYNKIGVGHVGKLWVQEFSD